MKLIVLSAREKIKNEASLINKLFEKGIERYHLDKDDTSEQSLAEILEGVSPKYLSQITLHSQFHLVLAFGVGGIHYSESHRLSLGDEFLSKVELYQSFGIKVSSSSEQPINDPIGMDYILEKSSKMSGRVLLNSNNSNLPEIKWIRFSAIDY